MKQLGGSSAVAGFVTGSFILGALASRFIAGKLLGYLGFKQTLLIGLSLALLSALGYVVAPTIPTLTLVRIFHGLSFGIITSATVTITSSIVPSGRTGEGMGYYALGMPLALAIGPFFGTILAAEGNYTAIFIGAVLITLIPLVAAPFMRLPRKPLSKGDRDKLTGFRLASFFEVSVLPISMMSFGVYLCYAGIMSFLVVYVQSISLPTAANWFFPVFAVTMIALRPFTGKLLDKRGPGILVYPALVSLAIGLLLLSVATNLAMFIVSACLSGFGFGAMQTIALTLVALIAPPGRRGVASSTYLFCNDVGTGIGPVCIGLLLPFLGYQAMYVTLAGIALAVAIFYCLVYGRGGSTTISGGDDQSC